MANADLGSLDFKLIIDDKEFNKSVDAAIQKAKSMNASISQLLDLRKQYNATTKEDVTNARNSNRVLREENKTREMNRREIIRTRKELVKLNAEKAKANGVSGGGSLAAQQSMLSNITNLAMKYVSIWGAASLIKNIANITAEFELQKVALEAMIADTQKANQVYNQIWDLALKSPFNAKELVTYAKQLVAYSIPVGELFETTKMLADVSAGLGVGMDRLVLAYGQIRSASFLRGQEVRQLTEAGIPILEELRKQFVELGEETITVGDVFDKISKRLVPFEMVEKVFKNMTSEGGKFYQMQEVQAETLKGKIMILKDAYDKMFNAIGTKNKSTLKGAVEWATKLARNYDSTMGKLKTLVAAYGAYKVALELAVLGERGFLVAATVKKIVETTRKMKALTGSAQTLAVVMRNIGEANVKKAFASLAGAVAMVATALIVAIRNAGELKRELNNIASTKFTEAQRSINDFDKLVDRLNKATRGSQKYRDAISELNNKYGDYLPNLLNEKNALDEIAKSYDRVTNAIYSQAKAYAYEEAVRKVEEKQGVKLSDRMAGFVRVLTKEGIDKEAAQIFVRNFTDELKDASVWTHTFDVFTDTWKDVMGDLPNPFEDYLKYNKGISYIVDALSDAARKYKKAEEDLNDIIEARFGGEGFSTVVEKDKIGPIMKAYAEARDEILGSELSASETEAKLEEAQIEHLNNLITAYKELNDVAKEAKKEGLWDNQIKKYTAELNALTKPDLTWLQKIVNPLADDKNRDLRPQISDNFQEYVDNLRNIYKKQVTAVDDLSDSYNKFLNDRKKGIKVDEDAFKKSEELYQSEKKRKEVIEAIGRALGISVDDKVTGNSGKSAEQTRIETQINTLKDMEKWYDKLKDLNLGEDTVRDVLKRLFPDQEILTTTKSFRDELLRLADALAKFDEKAAQALRDDVAGYYADDYIDNVKKAIEATKKLDTLIKKLREETIIEGTGVSFDISKTIHDYRKRIRDINEQAQEALSAARESSVAGNVVDFSEVLSSLDEWGRTQSTNALNEAIDKIDGLADAWVKDWAKINGVDLEHWSDMTIAQLKGVRDALEEMFDERGNLIADDDKIQKIKDSLSAIPGGWEAFVKSIKSAVGKDANVEEGGGLLGKLDDVEGGGLLGMLDDVIKKEKVKGLKYAAQSILSLSDSLVELGKATGDDIARQVGGLIRDVSSLSSDIAEGYAIAGAPGAAIGALKSIGTALLQNAAAAEAQVQALRHVADVSARIYNLDKNIELLSGGVFGGSDLKALQETVISLDALNKDFTRLFNLRVFTLDVAEAQEGMLGLSESVRKMIESINLTTYDSSKGFFGWLRKFFEDREWTNIKDLADEMGYTLYDEYGYLNAEFLRKVLEIYSEDLNSLEKDLLQSAIEYSEKANEYIKSIESSMESLVGSAAEGYADSIVNQWVEAGNAAADYIDILDDVARSYAKMMVKNILINEVFTKELQDELTKATVSGDAEKAMRLLDDAMQKASGLAPTIEPVLEKLGEWLGASGTESSLGQGIKGVTEDTANLLASYINGMRADLAAQRMSVERMVSDFEAFWKASHHPTLDEYLNNIEANTFDTARNTSEILMELRSVIVSNGGNMIRVVM